MRTSVAVASLLFCLNPTAVDAFWRLACSVSQTSRIDPILNPGTIAGHVHKFAGGNNVNANSTRDSLIASSCSTCQVQSDKSAYWTPQLYYQHGNGSIQEVPNDGMTVYYVGRGGDASNTKPFPSGFKMISGNSLLRHYDSSTLTYQNTRPVADRVSFRCINEANDIPETHYLNQTNCVNGLRAQVNFQSCWDGVNLYKPDQSHVAYLSGIDYGSCPPTHPVPIPGLFFEVLYWSNRVDQTTGGHFVFSNGDTTGYGFHGDFLDGWDQDVQAQAVSQCLYANNNGVVESCAPLQASNDVNFARTCPEAASVLDEAARGALPTKNLPGCNPITYGPEDVKQIICAVNSTSPISDSPVAANTTSVAATVLPSPSVGPGQFFTTSTTVSDNDTSTIVSISTITTLPTTQSNDTISSTPTSNISTSAAADSSRPESKLVTIAIPGYTTIALLIPASLTPDTSYSDVAEATSYINALTSLAAAEASDKTRTSTPTGAATITVTATVTVTSLSGTSTPQGFFTVTGTKTTFVTQFNPTVTVKVTNTAEVTITGSSTSLPSRLMARGKRLLRELRI